MSLPTDSAARPWGETLTRRRVALVLTSVVLSMLLGALDQTVVGTAMPRVIADLNGLQHYAWVTTAYMLSSTVSMPIWGKLSDTIGRRRFFLLGMSLFVVGSALCGFSRSMGQLIAFRALRRRPSPLRQSQRRIRSILEVTTVGRGCLDGSHDR